MLNAYKNRMTQKPSWRRVKTLLIQGLFFFFFLEIFLAICIKLSLLNIIEPSYTFNDASALQTRFDNSIGFVPAPLSKFQRKQYCYDISYDYNSMGFLGNVPSKSSKKSKIILLGDSFLEGYGVSEKERMSFVLDTKIKQSIVNLSLVDKGPTQYLAIYKKYGMTLNHSAVLIGIYPENDFYDDDPKMDPEKTRPHWIEEKDTMIYCPPDFRTKNKQDLPWYKLCLLNYTYSYNAYLWLKGKYILSITPAQKAANHSAYCSIQFRRLSRSIIEFRRLAPTKRICIFTIPSKKELRNSKLGNSKLIKELKALCDSLRIEFINLPSIMSKLSYDERKALYYTCDSHWSPKGNQFVAEEIKKSWSLFQE